MCLLAQSGHLVTCSECKETCPSSPIDGDGQAIRIDNAYFFFGFNLLSLGAALVAFFAVLVLTSWALGLLAAGLILRYGLAAEELAWSMAFLLLPLSCVYYPVSVLPDWLQPVALALPSTHVFEGMRSILLQHTFNASDLWWALGLNSIYLVVGYAAFSWFLQSARVNGSLLRLGE